MLWRPVDAGCLHPNVKLQYVRLQCYLAGPRKKMHVPAADDRGDVAEDHVDEDWYERRVWVHLVVLSLRKSEVLQVPPNANTHGKPEEGRFHE